MAQRPLDLDSVETFVRVVELASFTQAAQAMGTTQAAVSLKLKRLEDRLGCRLVERTPRYVQASAKGAGFLEHARELLRAHEQALAAMGGSRERLSIGISDHVAGPELPSLIARMSARDPQLLIEIRIGSSGDLLQAFDRRELDAVLVRLHADRDDGELLLEEALGWFASPGWHHRQGEPVPLCTLAAPCGVRAIAAQLLDEAAIPWTEVFVGGGIGAVAAAVVAGLGIAAISPRMLPLGCVEVGSGLLLPPLPSLPVLLHERVRNERSRAALAELSAAFKGAARA
jgi:DNA-binding transcriptional LysR family regulator